MERDRPRQMKEQEAEMEKMAQKRLDDMQREDSELEKSGEMARQIEVITNYLKSKNINAQKTGKGTFVKINQQGAGPQAADGKYVNVKYTGKFLTTDSVFQANSYSFQLGKLAAIRGWDEGIPMFRQGGKGTLYIPGFLAYGKNPPPGSPFKVNEPLVFDIEVLSVSDTAINPRQ
jgi:FKBP-type peptidyl-prolyl cis-trans isomerase FkpA